MPNKTCKNCQHKSHVRVRICPSCQQEFVKKISKTKKEKSNRQKKIAKIAVGSWIDDTPKDMPKVSMPSGLENEPQFLNNDTVKEYISYEGLGFCLMDYIPSNRLEDKDLKVLWEEARLKMVEIIKHLENQ